MFAYNGKKYNVAHRPCRARSAWCVAWCIAWCIAWCMVSREWHGAWAFLTAYTELFYHKIAPKATLFENI